MAVVTVRRGQDLGGLLRRMKVELDGAVVARLRQGASVDIHVTPGRHVFRVKLDWLASAPLELTVEQGTRTVLSAAAGEAVQTYRGTFRHPQTALELSEIPC